MVKKLATQQLGQFTRPAGTTVHAGHHSAASNGIDQNSSVVHGARGANGAYQQRQQTPSAGEAVESAAIGALGTGGVLMPAMFMGNMGSGILNWGAKKAFKPETALKFTSNTKGFFEALQSTRWKNRGDFKQNFTEVKGILRANGGELPAHLAEEASKGGMFSMVHGNAMSNTKLTAHLESGAQASGSVGRIQSVIQPVTLRVANGLGALDTTRPGKAVNNVITKIADSRITAHNSKGTAAGAVSAGKWASVKNAGGLGGLLKRIPAKFGRGSIFNVLAMAGAAMGTSALLLTNRRENRQDLSALKGFAADIYGVDVSQVTTQMLDGPDAHPMVAEANILYKGAVKGRKIYGSMMAASDAIMGGTLTGALPGIFFLPEMALPSLAGNFMSDNQTLQMHKMLKAQERGEIDLAPEQRMQATAQLLATVPAIAKHGGINNDYVGPLAYEMVSRGMDTQQMMQTMATPQAFNAITNEVIAKVKTEQAKAQKAAGVSSQNPNAQKAADAVSHVTKAAAQTGPNIAPAKIQASETEHHGTIAGKQTRQLADKTTMSHAERFQSEPIQNNQIGH